MHDNAIFTGLSVLPRVAAEFRYYSLVEPWFVFITECEFDDTDMVRTPLLKGGMYQAFVHIEQ